MPARLIEGFPCSQQGEPIVQPATRLTGKTSLAVLGVVKGQYSALQWGEGGGGRKNLLEAFTFKDENDYEYEIWRRVFSHILKI